MTSIMPSAASRPTLAKNARMGHPRFVMEKEEQGVGEGWASSLNSYLGEIRMSACFAELRWGMLNRSATLALLGATLATSLFGQDETLQTGRQTLPAATDQESNK